MMGVSSSTTNMILTLVFFSFGLSVAATGVILPLYAYPGTNAAAWASVKSAVTAYPKVQWQIIINPNSGPGTNPSSPYPDANYIAGIKTLNALKNVKTLGYVDTTYGKRSYEAIWADINNYTNWDSYTKGDIGMDGIFFDNVPSVYDFPARSAAQTSNETYYKNIAAYASATIPSDVTPVVFNPGNPAPASFFEYADTIVGFENTQAAYRDPATLYAIASYGGKLAQTAIIAHDSPKSMTAKTIDAMIHTMKTKKIEFVYLGTGCCYNTLNGSQLKALASACDGA